jgi:hypothetical protein
MLFETLLPGAGLVEFLSEWSFGSLIAALVLGVDLTLAALADKVAGELPQHRGSSLLANIDSLVQLGEEVFVEHDPYSLYVEILYGSSRRSQSNG